MTRNGEKLRRFAAWLLASIGLVFVCLSQARGEVRHADSGIRFPDRIGQFERLGSENHEALAAGLGVSYRYSGRASAKGCEVVIYIYNLKVREVPSDLQHPMLSQIRHLARLEIAQQGERESWSLRPIFADVLAVDHPQGLFKAFFDGFAMDARLETKGGAQVAPGEESRGRSRGYQFAAVWSAKNHFVKLKASRGVDSLASPADIAELVKALLVQTHLP
jgi:hypothetical protein